MPEFKSGRLTPPPKKLRLSDGEKREIDKYLKLDQPLPDRYRLLLFRTSNQVELLWDGKSPEVTKVVLPFQSIEQIDEPRLEINNPNPTGFAMLDLHGRQIKGWTNKLIWGNNKYILSSLKNGHLRKEIEDKGGIKLIYIDPPFDVGADFKMEVEIPGVRDSYLKEPNVLEQLAYRDTWGRGQDSFLSMIYERMILMRDLLSVDGSIYVHCDWRVNSAFRFIMDELFGKCNFRNEIVWHYKNLSATKRYYPKKHDNILFYSKSHNYIFNSDEIRIPYSENSISRVQYKGSGFALGKKNWINEKGQIPDTVWEIPLLKGNERTGYPTQKPEKLLERIIKASSNEDDIVCDFFCGSGTLAAVAEKLNRKWICADLGKFAIHTTRKRLISVQRQLKSEGKNYRPFEVLNLGRYQRKYFLGREKQEQKEKKFEKLILDAYSAYQAYGFKTFSGKKHYRMVSIGPVNHPVSRLHVREVIKEALENNITKIDVLGFEYEMGLFPTVREEASEKGVDIQFKRIPMEVFDKMLVEKREVRFYDVCFIEAEPFINKNNLIIKLTDFQTFYNLDLIEQTELNLKNGTTKRVVSGGKIIEITKDKLGIINKRNLIKKWSDWIDYWSVDFDFQNRKEIIRLKNKVTHQWEEIETGDYIFDNEWQSFRTKDNPELELTTASYQINKLETKVAVKVVDIFGNDTMKVIDIRMK